MSSDLPSVAEKKERSYFRITMWTLLGLLVFLHVTAIFYYRFPDFTKTESDPSIKGDTTLATLTEMAVDMTDNWMPNDVFWPTILLDNPQNFQLGQLEILRYTVRVLRDNLTRLRTTDRIDVDADAAYTNFSNDPMKWMLPSAESKFKAGVKHLELLRSRIQSGQAHFYPRADNLIELLQQLNSLLGGVSTQLSNIPNDYNEIISEETAGDPYLEGEKAVVVKASWWEVDNIFYHSQGVAFALHQVMLAVRTDFDEILQIKKATELVDKIILILKHTQWEPKYTVMNCSPGSWIPCQNDPMMLSSRLQEARQRIRSVISMLQD